jgi:hypothetical protein
VGELANKSGAEPALAFSIPKMVAQVSERHCSGVYFQQACDCDWGGMLQIRIFCDALLTILENE